MATPKLTPFSDDDCGCFTRTIERGGNLQELLDCLQECGIDMAPISAENKETVQLAEKLKAKFFPGAV